MIGPNSTEGRVVAKLIGQAAQDVRFEIAKPLIKAAQGQRGSERTVLWAEASATMVGRLDPEDWPRVFGRLQALCAANGLANPFTDKEVKAILAEM